MSNRDFYLFHISFSYCVQNVFSFGFIKAFDSKQTTCQNVQGLHHQSGNKHPTKNGRVWKKLLKC